MTPDLKRFLGILLVGTTAACADESFTVRHAPDFPKGGATISIFGVFANGRMNTESWQALGPSLSSPFSKSTCEVVFSNKLVAADPALAAAADDYAKANGVTEDLLDHFSPMAQGDTILFISLVGNHGRRGAPKTGQTNAPPRPPPTMRGGHGHRGTPPSEANPSSSVDHGTSEIAASLYSVRLRRSVSLLRMTYSGSETDALKKFVGKLAEEIPGSTCSGWKWDVHLEHEAIGEP